MFRKHKAGKQSEKECHEVTFLSVLWVHWGAIFVSAGTEGWAASEVSSSLPIPGWRTVCWSKEQSPLLTPLHKKRFPFLYPYPCVICIGPGTSPTSHTLLLPRCQPPHQQLLPPVHSGINLELLLSLCDYVMVASEYLLGAPEAVWLARTWWDSFFPHSSPTGRSIWVM